MKSQREGGVEGNRLREQDVVVPNQGRIWRNKSESRGMKRFTCYFFGLEVGEKQRTEQITEKWAQWVGNVCGRMAVR